MDTDRSASPRADRNRRFLRLGLTALAPLAFVLIILRNSSALARSLGRIGHSRVSWVVAGVVLEALSMTTFAVMQSRLLRVGGNRVGAMPMIATVLAANSLSVSVPVAGPELGAALTFRRFRDLGADRSLASWTLVVGGVVSSLGATVVLAAGGVLSGNLAIAAVTILVGLLAGLASLALWLGLRHDHVRTILTRVSSWVIRAVSRLLRRRPEEDPGVAVTHWFESLQSLRPSKAEWNVIGALGLGNWFTDVGVLAVSILALGAAVPWRSLVLVYALAIIVGSLGLTPGGLGLVEGTLCVGLVSAGLPAALALGAVLLYRLVSFWLVMLIGWLVFFWLRLERCPRRLSVAQSVVS
jgi:putative heme transporter